MNYDLAKKLKDAGFPVQEHDVDDEYGMCHRKGCDAFRETLRTTCCIPTLEELIESCGEGGFCLADHETEWCAILGLKTGRGSTPEEAVANLWLALNEKP